MTDNVLGYAHAAMLVSDIERSARFYETVFGWERLFQQDVDGSLGDANGFTGRHGRILMGEVGGVRLELVQMDVELEPRPLPPRTYGLHMVSVTVRDADLVVAACADADIPVRRDLTTGEIRLVVVADPDGQEVGIIQGSLG